MDPGTVRALDAAAVAIAAGGPVGVTPLGGDAFERVWLLDAGGELFVARILGPAAEAFGADHGLRDRIGTIASQVGAGPEIVARLPEHRCLVTRHIRVRTPLDGIEAGRGEAFLAAAAGTFAALHAAPLIDDAPGPSAFRLADRHRAWSAGHGTVLPLDVPVAAAVMARIEGVLGQDPAAALPRPCQRRATPGDLVFDGERLHLTGFSAAGADDPMLDLATFAAGSGLSEGAEETLLGFATGGGPGEARLARLRVLRVAAGYFEAMRELVLATMGDPGATGRASEHLREFLKAAADPRFEEYLSSAPDGGDNTAIEDDVLDLRAS